MKTRFLVVPLGTLSLAIGATGAEAALVGDSGQSQTGDYVTNQANGQSDHTDGIDIGNSNTNAVNSSATTGSGSQTIAAGAGAIVGGPQQSHAQSAATNQGIVGGGLNDSSTTLTGTQAVLAIGGTIVGSPRQSGSQRAATNQAIDGDGATNSSSTTHTNTQIVNASAAVIVGSPRQSSAQNSAVGQGIAQSDSGSDYTATINQSGLNDATLDLTNAQVAGGPGSIIVGSPGQANGQNGAIGQQIAQDVSGDFNIGTFDQTGSNSETLGATNTSIIL